MFNEQLFILFNLEVILLKQNADGWIIAINIHVHGRVVVARVLCSIKSTMLLRQLLKLLFYLLLSLQYFSLLILLLLNKGLLFL